MIRTTISRIKRVWAITFSPGLLRGDVRYAPGKFQILSPTTQNSPRRSKSTSGTFNDNHRKAEHGGAASSDKDVFDDYLSSEMRADETMHGAPPLYRTTSACRCDECNKIIAEIFGEDTKPGQKEHELKKKLLTNIVQVNMADNIESDKSVSDKTKLGFFQQKNKGDDGFRPELIKENIDSKSNTITKDNIKSINCHKVVLMEDTGDKKSKQMDVDAHQMYTNLYDVDPDEYQCQCTDTKKNPLSNEKLKDRNVDAYWRDVYETAVGENSVYCEHTLSIDEDTLNVYKVLKSSDSKVDDTSLRSRGLKHSPRELEKIIDDKKMLKGSSKKLDREKQVLKASTVKQDDEKLIQKVEHISETPLVEAEKSKLEDAQNPPRVLGNAKKTGVLNSLDEVAKRCLTSPQSQIDEILLKEMEKLGIPLTMQRSSSGLKMGDNKAETFNKSKRIPKEEEVELDEPNNQWLHHNKPQSSQTSNKSNNIEKCKELEVNPFKAITQYHLDFHRTKMDDLKSKENANLESVTETNVCDSNSENKSGWSYWSNNYLQQQDPKRSGTSEQEYNTNFVDRIWQKKQLDPKHVLTCNETCAISPKPLINENLKDAKNTESMYGQQYKSDEYMKSKPLLEDGESHLAATGTENKAQYPITADYVNPSTTVDFKNDTNSAVTEVDTNSRVSAVDTNSAVTAVDMNSAAIAKDAYSGAAVHGVEHQTHHTSDTPTTESNIVMAPSELPKREVGKESKDDIKTSVNLTEDGIEDSVVIDHEQLQLTTEQLHAASEQLQVTCEHLQATTEQLQAATIQLQATSNYLCDSSDKLHAASENLFTTTEKLQFTSENLRDTTELIGFDQNMLMNKISSYPALAPNRQSWGTTDETGHADEMYQEFLKKVPSIKEDTNVSNNEPFINNTIKSTMNTSAPRNTMGVTPAATSLIYEAVSCCKKSSETEQPSSQQAQTKGKEKVEDAKDEDDADLKELDDKYFGPNIEGLAQQATTITPSVPMTEDLPPIKPLPEINNDVKLSEVMKLVRERNRLVDCHEATVLAKPRKSIPPLSRPMANPPATKMPGIADVRFLPRTCLPKKGKPTTKKFSCCDLEMLGLDKNTSFIARNESQDCLDTVTLDQNEAIDLTLLEDGLTADKADDFVLQLHLLGNVLESSYKQSKTEFLEAAALAKTGHLAKIFRSQDYEPWSPIPSWPYPKKDKRQKLQCPKDGCKIPPPMCEENRPCGLKPCETFPTFPKRTFSLLDCYPTYISKHKVVDVGDF